MDTRDVVVVPVTLTTTPHTPHTGQPAALQPAGLFPVVTLPLRTLPLLPHLAYHPTVALPTTLPTSVRLVPQLRPFDCYSHLLSPPLLIRYDYRSGLPYGGGDVKTLALPVNVLHTPWLLIRAGPAFDTVIDCRFGYHRPYVALFSVLTFGLLYAVYDSACYVRHLNYPPLRYDCPVTGLIRC